MMIKGLFLVAAAVFVGVFANEAQLNKGNVALELSARLPRSAQQTNLPGFPNFVPPGFDNSNIVSQHTDSNKNGFAQTTIYKSDNGMGSSSVSVAKSGSTTVQLSFSCLIVLLAAVPQLLKMF
ncbi:conserved hypothetical protein [Culex quinquefasciatus]|uniref:Uncharacterized protein n=1 Tax=Culex quinquefasciatus TaxID=7176 RepID=B0X3X5_CULQU|nr:conserved hypothetical protein [Culex quinquefasciatus]|eukprot:XP_001864347.1 conserved hypothetical protein [Culex quinquefasciatus]